MTEQPNNRKGILGGSFDPIHMGHLAIAKLAYENLGLREVLFIPNRIPPHKKLTIHASAQQRLQMLRLACEHDGSFRIWEGELHREGPSYTADTLSLLHQSYPDTKFFFIIGTDNLSELPTWHRYNDIINRVTLAVVDRPGYPFHVPQELNSSDIVRFPSPQWGVSSTDIRTLRVRGLSCTYLIPEPVRTFIDSEGLYRQRRDDEDEATKRESREKA